MSDLPSIRRVITGHDVSGKSIVLHDAIAPSRLLRPGLAKTSVADIFRTEEFPSSNGEPGEEWVDPTVGKETELVSKGGSVFSAVDMPPGAFSPFHRTISIDYALITHGSLVCVLDDGKRVTLNTGDTFVQRGTIHAWINESKTEWARMYAIMLPTKRVEVDGKLLEIEFRPLVTQ